MFYIEKKLIPVSVHLYALLYSLNMLLPFYLFMADFKTCTVGYTCQIKNRIIAQCLELKTSIIS